MGAHRTPLLAAALLPALLGCDPFAFDDLGDEASSRVIEAPEGSSRRGFGRVVIGYAGETTEPLSRVAVTSGPDSPYDVFPIWRGGALALDDAPLFEGCEDLDCDEGAGSALAMIPVWRAGSPDEGRLCLLVPAPTVGSYVVRCETGGLGGGGERFTGVSSQRFGAAVASLPRGNPIGVAVAGAPAAAGATGALYRIPDGSGPVEIAVDAAIAGEVLIPDGELGAAVAVAVHPDGRTLIAAGAPVAGRVVVLSLLAAGDTAVVAACLDDPAAGFGGTLAWGDLDGDGMPDLFAGSAPTVAGRAETLRMYRGADLPDPAAPGACGAWGGAPVEVACPGGLRDGLAGCGGFGGAVAVGDVDADGLDDLLVGAPEATVDGAARAGAVYLIPGSAAGPDPGRADVLTHSSPEAGDELGYAVAAAPTHLDGAVRVEPVAGIPGRDAVVVFLCSGLTNDTSAVGARCVAR